MGPTHGTWCNAVTWPTQCPGCKSAVFFFRCDHGSKVFFDELGGPWPIHDCDTSWTRNLNRKRDNSGGITVEITEGITVRRVPDGFSVESGVVERALRRKKQSQEDPIVAIKAEADSIKITVIGILREKEDYVDILKFFKLPGATPIIMGLLGSLGKGEWGKITLHEPSSNKNIQHSYTIWVPRKYLGRSENRKGITVLVEIAPISILDGEVVWVCRSYEILAH